MGRTSAELATERTPETKTVRCAIYTRKSTEEGLQQEFNSLDAQREASEAQPVMCVRKVLARYCKRLFGRPRMREKVR